MTENVLEKIINIKSEKISELKKKISLESLEELIKKNLNNTQAKLFEESPFLKFHSGSDLV